MTLYLRNQRQMGQEGMYKRGRRNELVKLDELPVEQRHSECLVVETAMVQIVDSLNEE